MHRYRLSFLAAPARAALALAALGALSGHALAQTPGVYTGTTAQGQPVTIVVSTDAGTGVPLLTMVSVGYTQTCSLTGRVLTDGYGVGSAVTLDAQGGIDRRLYFIRGYGTMKATYDAATATYTGTTSMYAAKLLPTLPLQAENCNALSVPFTATLNPSMGRSLRPSK